MPPVVGFLVVSESSKPRSKLWKNASASQSGPQAWPGPRQLLNAMHWPGPGRRRPRGRGPGGKPHCICKCQCDSFSPDYHPRVPGPCRRSARGRPPGALTEKRFLFAITRAASYEISKEGRSKETMGDCAKGARSVAHYSCCAASFAQHRQSWQYNQHENDTFSERGGPTKASAKMEIHGIEPGKTGFFVVVHGGPGFVLPFTAWHLVRYPWFAWFAREFGDGATQRIHGVLAS